jgi:YcxB-like protein
VRIRFENTIDDFVALARYHSDHSPAARRVRVRATWIFAIAFLLLTAGLGIKISIYFEEQGIVGWYFALAAVSPMFLGILGAVIRMPGAFRRQAERQARQTYAEGNNKAVLGPRELQLDGNELVSRSTYAESRIRLEALERVVTDGAYTFIYLNSVTAYVIPHDSVLEGDPEKFAKAILSAGVESAIA